MTVEKYLWEPLACNTHMEQTSPDRRRYADAWIARE